MERHALFFTDPDAKRIYKENVKYTLLRKNSVNGRTYKDDPTIFSWGLLNEPRCETWKVRELRTGIVHGNICTLKSLDVHKITPSNALTAHRTSSLVLP